MGNSNLRFTFDLYTDVNILTLSLTYCTGDIYCGGDFPLNRIILLSFRGYTLQSETFVLEYNGHLIATTTNHKPSSALHMKYQIVTKNSYSLK